MFSFFFRCFVSDENRNLYVRIAELEKEVEQQKTHNELLLEKHETTNVKVSPGSVLKTTTA